MDYSEILQSTKINIYEEYSLITGMIDDIYQLNSVKTAINRNYHCYPFSNGTLSYRELLSKIDQLKIDDALKFILYGQAISNLFDFAFNTIKTAELEISVPILEDDLYSSMIFIKKIRYVYDKLGYEIGQTKVGSHKKKIAIEKNSLAKSISMYIDNIELSNSIMKYNYVDSDYEVKHSIVMMFYRYFDKNKIINDQINDSTNGIKRTFKNLLRIMETLKHGEKHPQSIKFILADKQKWTDIAYNFSLEVFQNLLNKKNNELFEQSLRDSENSKQK